MSAEPPRYADNLRLSWIRRIRDPERRYQAATTLQEHYRRLADEAGNIKIGAAADVYRETLDYDKAAQRIGRDARWVQDAVRILGSKPEDGARGSRP